MSFSVELFFSGKTDESLVHFVVNFWMVTFLVIFQSLLSSGSDMDAKNDEEQTPLHLAAKSGKTK